MTRRIDRKPKFARQESWRYKRVNERWRKPKGGSSRMRRRKSGLPPIVSIGYGTPKAERGLHPSGYEEIIIFNPDQLEDLNREREAVRIAATVGEKKRLTIMEKAEKLGLKVINPPRIGEEDQSAELKLEESEK